jgi:hypothetical protein
MIPENYDGMSLENLRQYILTHREDNNAFHSYIDRSKATGRMISIDPSDPQWEENLEQKIQQVNMNKSNS